MNEQAYGQLPTQSEPVSLDDVLSGDVERSHPPLDAIERATAAESSAVRFMRRQVWVAWTATALSCVVAVGATLSLSLSLSRAVAQSQVQGELSQAARAESRLASDELRVLQREHAVAVERAKAAEREAQATRTELLEQARLTGRLEAEKRKAEQALHAALSSLYERSPQPPATAAVPAR